MWGGNHLNFYWIHSRHQAKLGPGCEFNPITVNYSSLFVCLFSWLSVGEKREHMHLQCGWSQTPHQSSRSRILYPLRETNPHQRVWEKGRESVCEREFSCHRKSKQSRRGRCSWECLWLLGFLSKHYTLYPSTADTPHHKAPCVILCLCVWLWLSPFIFYIVGYFILSLT